MNSALNQREFDEQRDHALRCFVIDAARANPGLIRNIDAENFLLDQSKKPSHWRLSPGGRRWLIEIARDQLDLDVPPEFE